MSKFNLARPPRAATSPVVSEAQPTGRTHEGGPGYAREVKSELFLLAVTNMVGENTFYESADGRDNRYATLVRAATLADPEWTARLLRWLRSDANLRTAALVGAAEFTKARLDAGESGLSRQVVASVLQRADEPGELLAYWTSTHGRAVPKPVKRGIADAVRRLYDERSLIKWDSEARGFRFGDVIDLTHPSPDPEKPWQGALFEHALDRRHGRDKPIPDGLTTLRARAELMACPVDQRRALFDDPERARRTLRAAGMTWESVAGWLQGPMDAAVWEALVPSMGFTARLRNLRNFDEAGVSDEVATEVAAALADKNQVARSRQLPMRFLSAYRAAPSLRWGHALERALEHSLASVPALPGRTLVLVDTSGSMQAGFSKDGTLQRWDAAVMFGLALAGRCADAEVVSFSSAAEWQGRRYPASRVFPTKRAEPLLRGIARWRADGYFIGMGTDTVGAVRTHYAGHDRVVILTDEQAADGDVGRAVPPAIPLYSWNLAGYRHGHAPSGGPYRHAFGGLTDAAFGMIPLLEAGHNATWPF
ncbi:TROVE domain-containing protein [Nocardia sp. NPDC059180]|uniref:TROVE domain-containing protein n=1 Tax=Nocardia sp. NPDC059180 TaxID=3346761 RepID=UPI003678A245